MADLSADHLPAMRTNNSVEIFQWAYETMTKVTVDARVAGWPMRQCPNATAQADYGVANRAFFVDLNTVDPAHNPSAAPPSEYALLRCLSLTPGV